MSSAFYLGPDIVLTSEDVERIARTPDLSVSCSDAGHDALHDARTAFTELRNQDAPIYGITTGFGPLHEYNADREESSDHGTRLLAHLAAGSGDFLSPPVVRGMMAARLHTLAQGYSAIRPEAFRALADLLEQNIIPAVPEIGSLGASGDLTPLAHVARVLTGEGAVLEQDSTVRDADAVLEEEGLSPVSLEGRDALALVNATAFMTAAGSLSVARADRLRHRAEALTGWMYRLLGCPLQALDPKLHEARVHQGQIKSARAIRAEATRNGPAERDNRPFQEVYSLRCAPQILGAARDQIGYARKQIETELNGVTDNPVIHPEDPAALHGGNFQGQQVSFAADALNEALTQIGVLAERQLDVLLSADQNGGAPPLLAWDPGPNSGLAGAQLTATALVGELRQKAQMAGTSSIPTNGDNQDVVSMGALAARTAHEQTEHVASILAIVGIALSQLTALRREGRAPGDAAPRPDWMPPIDPVVQDRALRGEIEAVAQRWRTPKT